MHKHHSSTSALCSYSTSSFSVWSEEANRSINQGLHQEASTSRTSSQTSNASNVSTSSISSTSSSTAPVQESRIQESHHAQDIQDSGAAFTGMISMVDFNVDHGTFIDTDQVQREDQQQEVQHHYLDQDDNSKTSSSTSRTSTSTRRSSSRSSLIKIMIGVRKEDTIS